MQTDALLVNLHKSEKDFSPSTMYRDYAISSHLFHWESQNTTTTTSPTGRRYLSHRESGSHVVMFVRDVPTDDLGAAPFLCLGQADQAPRRTSHCHHVAVAPSDACGHLRRRISSGSIGRDSGASATHAATAGTAWSGNRNRPGTLNKAWG